MKTIALKKMLLVTVLAFISMPFFAQVKFEIRGKIIKSERPGGNYASVVLLDSKTREIVSDMVCNENGEFVIENVQKGEYILLVQKPGYAEPEKSLITINENGTVSKSSDITMQISTGKDNVLNVD